MFEFDSTAGSETGGVAVRSADVTIPSRRKLAALIARRELTLMLRGRHARATLGLLAVVAFLPPLLLSLRAGALGLASFREMLALALSFDEVALPLIGLLAGADLLAGESEDGTLVPLAALPISRAVCFVGKLAGRAAIVVPAYLCAFTSAGLAIALVRGSAGWDDYAAIAGGGLALCLVSLAIGVALGQANRGRTGAFGAATIAWIAMVFVLDAALLAAVVALAPAPPEELGTHGYGEMAAQREMMKLHELDDSGDQSSASGEVEAPRQTTQWLMVLDPVDLFRFTALSASPTLHGRARVGLHEAGPGWIVLAIAWLAWLAAPIGFALRRFAGASLK
ncbi:MAG TPA: ABC transporter permease [Candidatus Acidoferrales bacterium]|nr:ABC transporter permease [Candidatus Acidoferrales bacterium]